MKPCSGICCRDCGTEDDDGEKKLNQNHEGEEEDPERWEETVCGGGICNYGRD